MCMLYKNSPEVAPTAIRCRNHRLETSRQIVVRQYCAFVCTRVKLWAKLGLTEVNIWVFRHKIFSRDPSMQLVSIATLAQALIRLS